jgi:hypothetical protein
MISLILLPTLRKLIKELGSETLPLRNRKEFGLIKELGSETLPLRNRSFSPSPHLPIPPFPHP